jgi:arginase family enzyme
MMLTALTGAPEAGSLSDDELLELVRDILDALDRHPPPPG